MFLDLLKKSRFTSQVFISRSLHNNIYVLPKIFKARSNSTQTIHHFLCKFFHPLFDILHHIVVGDKRIIFRIMNFSVFFFIIITPVGFLLVLFWHDQRYILVNISTRRAYIFTTNTGTNCTAEPLCSERRSIFFRHLCFFTTHGCGAVIMRAEKARDFNYY